MSVLVSLILFIFAITSGSESGWASAEVLAPLVISVALMILFFLWEQYMPFESAAVYVYRISTHGGDTQ